MNNLQDLYVQQLRDLYSANRQTLDLISQMGGQVSSSGLKEVFNQSQRSIQAASETVATLVKKHGAEPTGEFCKGTEGLVKEAKEDVGEAGDDAVRDAVIIASMQRIAHYAIAAYGTCKALANRLGHSDDKAKLEELLAQACRGDDDFTAVAEKEVNPAAA